MNRKVRISRMFVPALVFLAGGIPLLAQTAGEIRGRVLDEAGAPLAGMTILGASRNAGISDRGALSDVVGAFRVPALPPASDRSEERRGGEGGRSRGSPDH